MSIDRSILSEFIKATNDNKETKQTQIYGTVVTKGNTKCVKIDGSEIVTPVRSITDIKDEERVIVSIKDHMATVTGNMTNPSVGNDRVESAEGKIDRFDYLFAGNITAENIAADSITADKILAGSITTDKLMAESIIADKIAANAIESKHIKADTIESSHIKANTIESDHIQSNTINSNHINSNTINSDHIVAGSITSENIATGTITAGSGIIAEGAIGSAQISSLDVAKLESGTIDTSKIYIAGADGHLQLKGNRLQVFDGLGDRAVERVSVGDVNGDGSKFGLRVRGADGETILLDENGVTSEGITDGSITNNKISDDANIDGAKLNINSVVSKINEDGTEVIKGTKISVNGTNLESKLYTIESTQSAQGDTITQNTSKITANEKAIALKVDTQTYTTDKENMTSQLTKNTSSIKALQNEISLKVESTDITNAINNIQVGGRNFILNSNFIFGVEYWNYLDGVIDYQNKKCAYQTMNTTSGETFIASTRMYNEQISGKTITLSFLAACTPNMRSFEVYILSKKTDSVKDWDYAPVKQFVLNEKLTKYTWTYVMPSDIESFYIRFDNNSSTDGQNATLYITDVKFEIGNKATDWTPAPEDITSEIDNKIYTAKSEIKITTDAITQNVSNLTQTVSTKADGSTVSTLSNKVGSLETSVNGISGKVSSLETTTTSIDSKVKTAQNTADSAKTTATTANNTANANKNNITNLQGEVKTVKSNVASLDVNLQGITQRVSSTESTTSTLTTKVNTAQNTADNVNNKLEGLKIGGTNLLKGTKDFSTGKGNATVDTTKYYDFTVLKNNVPSTGYADMCQWTNLSIKPNTEYTLSFYAKASVNGAKHYSYLYPDAVVVGSNSSGATTDAPDGALITTLTTEWKRYWVTWKTHSTLSGTKSMIPMRILSSLATTGVTTYICGVHFEEGNRSTDWSPSPEDVSQDATNKSNQALTDAKNYTNTQITTVNNKVASIQTDLNGITSRVTNTENNIQTTNNNVTNLTNRVATAESKITETAITNTVKKNFYTKTETDSAITSKGYQTSSQVQQTVDKLEVKFEQSGGYNLIRNSLAKNGSINWSKAAYRGDDSGMSFDYRNDSWTNYTDAIQIRSNTTQTDVDMGYLQKVKVERGKKYTLRCLLAGHRSSKHIMITNANNSASLVTSSTYGDIQGGTSGPWQEVILNFTTTEDYINIRLFFRATRGDAYIWIRELCLIEGELPLKWSPHPSEIYDGITTIDKDGIIVTSSNVKSKTSMSSSGFKITKTDTNEDVFKVNSDGTLYMKGEISLTSSKGIKGDTTRKIVIANDNYCVYDGAETDVNRKVFMGFRPYNSNAQYIPSVMLGYNGINPNVDGAVVSGGTYTTYSHYPNNNNPESINQSYGALAFKYGASGTQFSTLNMYQNGDIDLKAGSGIYFRPSLRNKNNHVFGMTDTEVGCRVPFKCTSTIFTNGDITTDRNIHAYGNISASGSMSCGTILPSNISIGSGLSINSNGIYTSGYITGNMVKTDSYRFTNNHIAFAKNDYNNNMMNGCHWDWQYCNLVNVKVYPVSLSLPTIDEPTIQTVSKTQKDTLSQIKFPEARELSVEESAPSIDISDVTNKEEITTNGDVDLIKLVYLLVKDVQTLKQENEKLSNIIKEIQSK